MASLVLGMHLARKQITTGSSTCCERALCSPVQETEIDLQSSLSGCSRLLMNPFGLVHSLRIFFCIPGRSDGTNRIAAILHGASTRLRDF